MREAFIYYRIHMNQIEMARHEILAFQARMVAVFPGLVARLLQRADGRAEAGGEHQTWMEHYRIDAVDSMSTQPGLTPEVLARIEHDATAQLSRWIAGPRHTEMFIPCAS